MWGLIFIDLDEEWSRRGLLEGWTEPNRERMLEILLEEMEEFVNAHLGQLRRLQRLRRRGKSIDEV